MAVRARGQQLPCREAPAKGWPMADEETQGQGDTSWWAPAAPTEPSRSTAGFDEPLVWPESPAWDEPAAGGTGASELSLPQVPLNIDGEFVFPPVPDVGADAGDGSAPDL